MKIKKVGICGTDFHAYAGNQAFFSYPRILGHELASQVIEIENNDNGIKEGDNVVVMPYLSCKKCIACKNGKTNCCVNMKVLGIHTDGGMQEKIAVPANLLIPAGNLNENEMAIVEPLAIGAHAISRAQLRADETILVVGCGPIGIAIMKFAGLAGAHVIAIDTNVQRMNYVKEVIGVAHTVLAGKDALEKVLSITDGDLCTAVFDATGHKGALETGTNYMAHGGRYMLVGLSKGDLSFSHPSIHAKEATLMCSRNANLSDFENVISTLQQGKFPTNSYITHTVNFSDMISEFDRWLDPASGVIKATVNF